MSPEIYVEAYMEPFHNLPPHVQPNRSRGTSLKVGTTEEAGAESRTPEARPRFRFQGLERIFISQGVSRDLEYFTIRLNLLILKLNSTVSDSQAFLPSQAKTLKNLNRPYASRVTGQE